MAPPGVRKPVFRRFMPTIALTSGGKCQKISTCDLLHTHPPEISYFLTLTGRS